MQSVKRHECLCTYPLFQKSPENTPPHKHLCTAVNKQQTICKQQQKLNTPRLLDT